jgi:hypothetical protein
MITTSRWLLLMLALSCGVLLCAQGPRTIAFQGALSGMADGDVSVTLTIYDALTGGTALWTQTKTVTVKKSLFATTLGEAVKPFPATMVFDKPYFVGVKVGNEELAPRFALQSAPYALAMPGITVDASENLHVGSSLSTTQGSLIVNGTDFQLRGRGGGVGNNNGAGRALVDMGVDGLHLNYQNDFGKVGIWGNVGVGTDAPTDKLTVVGGHVKIDINTVIGSLPSYSFYQYDGKTMANYGLGWFDDTWQPTKQTGWLSGYGGIKLFTQKIPRLAITQSGNVGIGTTTPANALDVNGDVSCNTLKASSLFSADAVQFWTGSNQRGVWTANGTLGIGTTSPDGAYMLDVFNGDIKCRALTTGTISIGANTIESSGNIVLKAGGAARGVFTSNGIFAMGTTTPTGNAMLQVIGGNALIDGNTSCKTLTLTSSRRFKDNIQPIHNPLATIMKLQGVTYTWKPEQGGKPDMGFIAEDVVQVLPELVTMEKDGVNAQGMDYSHLVALLVEGVKAQKGEIDVLRNTNYQQAQSIKQLLIRVEELEKKIQ